MQVTTSEEESEWLVLGLAALLRCGRFGDGAYWSMIDRDLRSSSLMQPCSAWGRNVVSISVSQAACYVLMWNACIPSAVQ